MSLEPSDEANVVGDFAETMCLKPMWAIVGADGKMAVVRKTGGEDVVQLMLFSTPHGAANALRSSERFHGSEIPAKSASSIVPLYLGRGPSVALRRCPDCRGDGFAWCTRCHGDGSSLGNGRACSACGEIGARYCPPCDGTGWLIPEELQEKPEADAETSDEEVLP